MKKMSMPFFIKNLYMLDQAQNKNNLATAKQLIRKNSLYSLKNQAKSQSERTDKPPPPGRFRLLFKDLFPPPSMTNVLFRCPLIDLNKIACFISLIDCTDLTY